MGDHKLIVFGEHRSEDETQADKDGAHDDQHARAIRVKDLADDRRKKELARLFVIRCTGWIITGSNHRTHREEELD